MTEQQIYEAMLETFRQETGYEMTEETDLAVRLRAAAGQIMGLYHYADYTLHQAFPQTAEGENLDRHGALRGVERQGATYANGYLQFMVSEAREEDLAIPAGTVCISGDHVAYETWEDAVLPAGAYAVEVAAVAVIPGSGGNAPVGTITSMQSPPEGIESVRNTSAFLGGRDQEEDESYRARILAAYHGLGNGANAAYYQAVTEKVDGVEYVRIVPRINGIGTVGIVLASAGDGMEEAVLEGVAAVMEEYREIGVEVTVLEAENVKVDISAGLLPGEGVTLEEAKVAAEAAVLGCFQGNCIGKCLYLSELTHAMMDTGKLKNVVISAPAEDVAIAESQRPVPGTISMEGV